MKEKILAGPWVIASVTLLLVAVVLIVGNQAFKATEQVAFDEFNQRQLALAREAATGIELYFDILEADLKALGELPEVQRLDEASTRNEIQHTFVKLTALGVNDVAVLDAQGRLRYNVAAHEIEGTDFSWRKYYQAAKTMTVHDSHIVEFIEFKGAEAGQKGVLVAVPMFETSADPSSPAAADRFRGVILCTLKLDTITQKFVAAIKSSDRGHALLVDEERHVLWSPDKSLFGKNLLEESQGFPAFHRIVESMSAEGGGTGAYSYYQFDESGSRYSSDARQQVLIAYTPISHGHSRWAIGVWAPQEDAQQLIRSVYLGQLWVIGLSLLIIFLGSGFALATTRRLAKILEREVEIKTASLKESRAELGVVLSNLEEERAFQQSILEGMAEPLMVISLDRRVKLMNRAARESWRGDASVLGSLRCYQIFHRSDAPCTGEMHPCPLEQVYQTGQSVTAMHQHYQADGTEQVVEIMASPLWGVDGACQGVIESIRDITQRVRAEAALRESESRFRQLFHNANDAIYLWELGEDGMPGYCLEANDVACQMLGYSLDELRTKRPVDIDAKDHVYQIPHVMQELADDGHTTFRMVHVSKTGQEIPVEISSHIFTLDDEKVILSITRDITERVRMEQEAEQRQRELAALNQIASAAARLLDPEALAAETLDAMVTALHTDGGAIYEIKEEEGVPVEIAVRGLKLPLAAVKLLAERVAEANTPLALSDARADADLSAGLPAGSSVRALLYAPLCADPAKCRGVLVLGGSQPREWTESEVHVATIAAQQIAIGLERAYLFREAQDRAESLSIVNSRLHVLQQISTTLSANLQSKDVLQTVLTSSVKQMGFPFSVLLLCDDEQQVLRIHAKSGDIGAIQRLELANVWPPRTTLPLSDTDYLPIQVLLTGEPRVCNDLHDLMGKWINRLLCAVIQHKAHIRQFALLPLRTPAGTIGVLIVAAPDHTITDDDLETLTPFAYHVAVAIENARLFQVAQRNEHDRRQALQHAITAQEEERKRIARELHDETLQALAGLVIGLDTTARFLDQDPVAVREQIGVLKHATGSIMDEVSGIIHALRPTMLDDLGLLPALNAYAEERLTPCGVEWCVAAEGEWALPHQIETVLFRAIQAAISNIALHAHARHAHIRLTRQADGVVVQVSDDGVGFDVGEKLNRNQGHFSLGLIGIQERVAMVDGRLDVVSSPGNGTQLRMWVPCRPPE